MFWYWATAIFEIAPLFVHSSSLHPIYQRPKGLFPVNAFYMNSLLCLCKPTYWCKQSSIEAQILNFQPDGFWTWRQSGELQLFVQVQARCSHPFHPWGLALREG